MILSSLFSSRLCQIGTRTTASATGATLLRRIATSGFVQDADIDPPVNATEKHPSASHPVLNGSVNAGITYDRFGEPYYDLAEGLYVSNLVEEITDDEIRERFSRFGEVMKCIRHHPNEATVYFKTPPSGITAALVHQNMARPFMLKDCALYMRAHARAVLKPLRDGVVVVYNILPAVTTADVEQLFEPYDVRSVTICKNSYPKVHARAFVRLGSEEATDRLKNDVHKKPMELHGQPLRIVRKTHWGEWRPSSSPTLVVIYPPHQVPVARDDIIAAFRPHGDVKALRFLRTVPGRPKGRIYLDFESEDVANDVLEAHRRNPINIRDIALKIAPAMPLISPLYKRNEEYRKVLKAIYHQDVRSRRLPSHAKPPAS